MQVGSYRRLAHLYRLSEPHIVCEQASVFESFPTFSIFEPSQAIDLVWQQFAHEMRWWWHLIGSSGRETASHHQ